MTTATRHDFHPCNLVRAREFGEYRTQRLVLEAWDAVEEVRRGN